MAEEYQNDGKCPRCEKRVRVKRQSLPTLDTTFTPELTQVECTSCSWPGD